MKPAEIMIEAGAPMGPKRPATLTVTDAVSGVVLVRAEVSAEAFIRLIRGGMVSTTGEVADLVSLGRVGRVAETQIVSIPYGHPEVDPTDEAACIALVRANATDWDEYRYQRKKGGAQVIIRRWVDPDGHGVAS